MSTPLVGIRLGAMARDKFSQGFATDDLPLLQDGPDPPFTAAEAVTELGPGEDDRGQAVTEDPAHLRRHLQNFGLDLLFPAAIGEDHQQINVAVWPLFPLPTLPKRIREAPGMFSRLRRNAPSACRASRSFEKSGPVAFRVSRSGAQPGPDRKKTIDYGP